MAHDVEAARHILQHLSHILAQLAHSPATGGTAIGIGGDMHRVLTRQMLGQWQPLGLAGRRWAFFRRCRFTDGTCGMGMFSFEIFQRQFQLIGHLGDPLGRLTELHPAQPG